MIKSVFLAVLLCIIEIAPLSLPQASVDLKGLKKLQAMLEKYQGILEMMEPETKEAAPTKAAFIGRE